MVALAEDAVGVGLHVHDLDLVREEDVLVLRRYARHRFVERDHAAVDVLELLLQSGVEVVDGIADVKYVAAYLQTLIESLGVDQSGAFNAVCDNNDEKWTTSFELAEKWLSQQTIPCYIQTSIYNNQMYYTVRKKDGDKVVKYQNFPKVDLTPFIPKEVLNEY